MKILHTSDWHLGRTLYGKKRSAEFDAFFDWLLAVIRERGIDALLVAGDVFDTIAPSSRTQQLYYRFLWRAAEAGCGHAVIVGGNHDSPSFLEAPKELLKSLNVHVVGAFSGNMEDELLTLRGRDGAPGMIVCAVPFLRDRDVRVFEADESAGDKERKTAQGIERHYHELGRLAEAERARLSAPRLPIVATGHLFAAGGRTAEGDGARGLYAGSLPHVSADCFPSCFDYVALGHLHSPQSAGGAARYSGSPLPMNAGEGHGKSVVLAEFGPQGPSVTELPVPVFQELARVAGDMETLENRLTELRLRGGGAWVEVVYEGEAFVPGLCERVSALTAGSGLEILRVKDARASRDAAGSWGEDEALSGLDESEVFSRCLDARKVPDDARPGLLASYREIIASLKEG